MRAAKFVIMVAVALGLLGFGGYGLSLMTIQDVVISGNQHLQNQEVRDLVSLPNNASFWTVDLNAIQTKLKQNSWVEDVSVRRHWAGKLLVEVVERKPKAVLSSGRGHFQLIDKNSEIIDIAQPGEIGKYPILTGVALLRQKNLREQALALMDDLPPEGALTKEQVSEIDFTEDRGFQLTLSDPKLRIRLGKENLSNRLDRVRRVIQYLNDHKITASHIDSDYAKKVLVKVQKPQVAF